MDLRVFLAQDLFFGDYVISQRSPLVEERVVRASLNSPIYEEMRFLHFSQHEAGFK